MTTIFTVETFRDLDVCGDGLARVEAFGGAIANTPEAWRAYVARFPEAWRAPLFTVWRLRRQGWAIDPDLAWKIARIAFREAGRLHPQLAPYAETLGPDNWRAAYAAADAAAAAYAYAAAYAADAYAAAAAYAYAAAYAADAYAAADAAADAAAAADDAADDADAAGQRVRAEIVELAIAALVAADPEGIEHA